nr:hypothetical protein [Oceanococcus sp. HetDA_MAG_MS8]
MRQLFPLVVLVFFAACQPGGGRPDSGSTGSSTLNTRTALPYGSETPVASCATRDSLEGGRAYQVIIPSRVDEEAISFQVHEPANFDCGQKHALILEGHGYGGGRQTAVGSFAQYTDSGYAVISIDQRGSPDSGGTVRVMDPDFEGEDLVAIVDWAEQHLDYLRYRSGNLLLGAIGGSYGGMYQYLLLNKDPDRRLDAIVPEIAPHDLTYSLNPNGVVKSQWALILAGTADVQTTFGQDPLIRATLLEGGVTGEFPEEAIPFFAYHSMRYFCENPLDLQPGEVEGGTSSYLLDPLFQLLPLTADGNFTVLTPSRRSVPRVDALIWQGPRDDLFNLNEAYRNYECLAKAGGDVRLLTYSFGHHFLTPNLGLALQALNTLANPLNTACGTISKDAAALAWFNDKLLGVGNVDDVLTTGQNMCLSLTEGDAVELPDMPIGGENFPVELPGGLPVPVVIANPAPVVVPLTTAGDGSEVLAGIPTATFTLTRGDPILDEFCLEESDPLLRLGTCDATVFAGLGVIRLGSGELLPLVPDLIEEQVIPINGLGTHEIEMVGVAERIQPGDQIVLLLYGLSDAFIISTARDVTVPVVFVSGEVQVPLQGDLPNITTR